MHNQVRRFPNDNFAKWDPKNRKKTESYEEAAKILMLTGKLPRPLRLADVKLGKAPLQKSIVATAKERRAIAELVGIYAVTRLQARMLVRREQHTVWGHDRIMVYAKMKASWLQPDCDSNDPMEMDFTLKFKCAFREDFDVFFPTNEARWNNELEKRGLRPDLVEGKRIEHMVKGLNPSDDTPENLFVEAILDNVVDLGEVVFQHFCCHIDKQSTNPKGRKHKYRKRMQKRMSKELGMEVKIEVNDPTEDAAEIDVTAQQIHNAAEKIEWGTGRFKKPNIRVVDG